MLAILYECVYFIWHPPLTFIICTLFSSSSSAHEHGFHFYSFFSVWWLVPSSLSLSLQGDCTLLNRKIYWRHFASHKRELNALTHTHIHSHLCVQCIKLEFMNCWKPNHIRRYEDILLMCFFRFPFCLSLSLAPMEITKRNIFFPHLWWDGFLISWQMKWEDI